LRRRTRERTEGPAPTQGPLAPRYRPRVSKRKPADGDPAPGLARLPPGRHGLPRSFVTQNQRGRLAAGTIAAVVEHGYHDATVSQISEAAGVSRRTFYGYFASKQEIYLDTYEMIASHLREQIVAAGAEHSEWPDRVRAGLGAMLETFADNPDLARFCLIAPLSADEEIAARYRLSMKRLLALLTAAMPPPPASRRPSRAAEDGLVGGIAAVIVRKVKAGEGERLIELLPDLLELALTPYLGRDDAVRAARR
jgi:AcrR family transcriptional regulator